MDFVLRAAETSADGVVIQPIRQAGRDFQTVTIRLDAQDRLADGEECPACSTGEPAVFGVAWLARGSAADRLGIDIGW